MLTVLSHIWEMKDETGLSCSWSICFLCEEFVCFDRTHCKVVSEKAPASYLNEEHLEGIEEREELMLLNCDVGEDS